MSAADVKRLFEGAKPYRPRAGVEPVEAGPLMNGLAFLASIPPPKYAIRPLAQYQHVIGLTGLTGHGKTTVANYLVACSLKGAEDGPISVEPLRVLMLIGENPPNAALQLRGAVKRWRVPDEVLAASLIVRPVAGPLAAIAESLKAEKIGNLDLVVVDTSASFFSYQDENDNVQARQHAIDLRKLTELPGRPSVIVNCHPVKNASRDNLLPRGGGAFLNELDANLTVWDDGEVITLHYNKLRGPSFDPIVFKLEPQDVGIVDDRGRPIRPPVAVLLSDSDEAGLTKQREHDENKLLYAMRMNAQGSFASWARDSGWDSDKAKSKVSRLMAALEADRLVKKYRGKWALTEVGKREAERIN
jgi:hypothetical protein